MPSIGPQMSPALPEKRKRVDEDDDNRSAGSPTSSPEESVPNTNMKRARVIGPSLPPAPLDERPAEPATRDRESNTDSEEEDDDDFGPSLPSTTRDSNLMKDANAAAATVSVNAAPIRRDDWMLKPPTDGDWSSKVDPTKLKNRKFNTGKGSKGPSQLTTTGADSWHETPIEKQARLKREIMGITETPTSKATSDSKLHEESTQSREAAKKLKDYNDKTRGPSLYNFHKQHNPQEKDDDPSARAFDREKDIAGGLQINQSQRREMVKKAADFQSRFSSAKYL